jgi:hypothetical protein
MMGVGDEHSRNTNLSYALLTGIQGTVNLLVSVLSINQYYLRKDLAPS